jgi:hypothetical protein
LKILAPSCALTLKEKANNRKTAEIKGFREK